MLRELLKQCLSQWIDKIDNNSCDMNEEDMLKVLNQIKEINDNNKFMSKYQAYTYLNMSRAKFDNLVREGSLPKGKKRTGFTELFWTRNDLDKAVKEFNIK